MAELIRIDKDGCLGFGDYTLEEKTKLSDFEYKGAVYKVKTFKDFTKLEKNEILVYESEPGTNVDELKVGNGVVSFEVTGIGSTQMILGLEDNTKYKVTVNDTSLGVMDTDMGGKLVLSAELTENEPQTVIIERVIN